MPKWDNSQPGILHGSDFSWAVDSSFPPVCWTTKVKIPILRASLPICSFTLLVVFMSTQWSDRGQGKQKEGDFRMGSKEIGVKPWRTGEFRQYKYLWMHTCPTWYLGSWKTTSIFPSLYKNSSYFSTLIVFLTFLNLPQQGIQSVFFFTF